MTKNLILVFRIECDYKCSRLYFEILNKQKILRKAQKATTVAARRWRYMETNGHR